MKSQGALPAKQKRSELTRTKLLTSLENLLKQKTFEEISITEIAAGAGVAPATIYRRFKNKEAFIPVIFEIYLQRLEEWSQSPEAQLEPQDLGDLHNGMKLIAQAVWEQLTRQSHILRAVFTSMRQRPELVGPELIQWEAQSLVGFRAIIDHFEKDIARSDKERAARMIAYFFNNIFLEYGLFEHGDGTFTKGMNADDFVTEIADFAYGYLSVKD